MGQAPPEAWSAGNIGHIGEDHNAVSLLGFPSHVDRGLWRRCAPWQWGPPFLRGRATATLAWRGHQTPWDALKRQNSRDTTLGATGER